MRVLVQMLRIFRNSHALPTPGYYNDLNLLQHIDLTVVKQHWVLVGNDRSSQVLARVNSQLYFSRATTTLLSHRHPNWIFSMPTM